MAGDPDATVVLRRKRAGMRPRGAWILAGGVAVALSAGAAWLIWHQSPRASAPPAPPPAVSLAPAPAPPLPQPPLPPLASEADILARFPAATETYRFQDQPEIVVMQFATMSEQAGMLNRAATLLERARFPRDRVLDRTELNRRIRDQGDTPETLYFGHDYRTADLFRFFSEAEHAADGVGAEEAALLRLTAEWGWRADTNGALITILREDRKAGIDAAARATILRHELSHGLYFTSPDYARYVRRFWDGTLTEPEHERFRLFLARDGYDTGIEDLVVNEMQAYLMHTTDERFFNAQAVGIAAPRLEELRGAFLKDMPAGWLRDRTVLPATRRLPRERPRERRQRFALLRTNRTDAEMRAPPRAAWSRAARRSRR